MTPLPIRWRLTIWYGSTLALLLLAFSLLFFLVMRHQLLAEVDRGLQEELRELTNEISLAKALPELLEQTRRRFLEHGVFHFQMIAPSGKILFESETLRGDRPLEVNEPESADRQHFDARTVRNMGRCRLIASIALGPGGPYLLRAVTSLKPFDQDVARLLTVLLLSGPVALAAGAAGGYTLARRVLAPVERIVEVANRITATDLHQRVDVVNPDDELGRLAKTLNALIDRLQKSIEEMRRFTADAAHELRTPLAVLNSGIEITLRSPRSEHEYRRALEAAGVEAIRLARLADQLLFLSRQDSGTLSIEREEVRLDALIQDVAEQLGTHFDEAGVRLSLKPFGPAVVSGDDIRLSRAVYNVIDNALKHTPRGGTITVRGCGITDGKIGIEIADTGCGIPSQHLPHVFKRFYRVNQSSDTAETGAGLGLAIAHSSIAAHGGTIDIQSEVGRGTVVRITLPCLSRGMLSAQEQVPAH